MKKVFLIFVAFFCLSSVFGQEVETRVSCKFINSPISDFATGVYRLYGVRVYYKPDISDNFSINCISDSISLRELVAIAVTQNNLRETRWNGNIILSKEVLNLKSIPNFRISERADKQSDNTPNLSETEKNYLIGRRPDVVETIEVGSASQKRLNGKAKVLGKITDMDSGESLIGATMFVEEVGLGVSTDQNGMFSVAINPGIYNVRFSCLGQKNTNCLLKVNADGEFEVKMEKSIMQVDEIYVYGDRSMNVTTRLSGLERIPVKTIKELPMMMGELDIIKVSELLPGIVSVGEGSAGINVRGGHFDQNGFYINKVPIYNTSHVFGFFPAFNPDLVKDYSIYKGHMPSEFGGRTSSIFNIITKQGNKKRYNLRGGINPVATNITFEGPIRKDTGAFMLSFRTNYSDWILKRFEDINMKSSSAKFSDIALLANYELNPINQLSAFVYYSNDFFKLSNINQYQYSNVGGSLDWQHIFSPSTRATVTGVISNYTFGTIDKNVPSLAYQHNYSISHYETKALLSTLWRDKYKVEAGASSILYSIKRGNVTPFSAESIRLPLDLGIETGIDNSLFASGSADILPWLNVYAGVRYSFYSPLGKATVYEYTENKPKDQRYIMDTLHFKALEPVRWYHGPEVRAALSIKTDTNGSIKFSYNQTRQNVFMLNNTITIAPSTQWKLADSHLKPALGDQVSFGIFRNIPSMFLEFSVETFSKRIRNFSEARDGANFIETREVERIVLQGEQSAYGVEIMLKRSAKRLNGWIAYTYSRSTVQVNGTELWQKINSGKIYSSNYDMPHVVNLVANYRISRRLNISTSTTYQQGRPITYPLSVYYIEQVPIINYSSRNEYRIPDYFRFDISLAIEGNLKRNKLYHSSWLFGVYNATGRKNPLSIFFKSENGKINGYKYSVIGTPIITATWVFKLGNYATE